MTLQPQGRPAAQTSRRRQTFAPPTLGLELARRRRQVRRLQRAALGDGPGSESSEAIRISVVGQVKAGKSTLINAVAGVHALIPSDINPWTSVMTSVRVGPGAGRERMVFDFFDREEWNSQRDARHAEALVGAFAGYLHEEKCRQAARELHSEYVRSTDALEDAARRELGPQFDRLWGTSVSHPGVSCQVLERYVCSASGSSGNAPRYSPIVRSARVFVDRNRFAVPVTLLDTPGINDPSLARAKLTKEVLAHAHITLVVVNAQQVMGTADRELLRMLSCLHKDRLVIFVNRMDQLDGGVGEAEHVRAHVRQMLAGIFPGQDVPVILGSARAAEHVWSTDAQLRDSGMQTLAFLERSHLPSNLREVREELYAKSGLAELSAVLSDAMLHGPGAIELSTRAAQALAQAGALLASSRTSSKTSPSESQIEAVVVEAQASLDATTERLSATMKATLSVVVEEESSDQLRTFMRRLATDRQKVLSADLTGVRARLEARFVAEHARVSEAVWQTQAHLGAAVIRRVFGQDNDEPLELTLRPQSVDPNPSLAPLMTPMSVEIGSLWRRFLARSDRVASKAYAFEEELSKSLGHLAAALTENSQAACAHANTAFIARLSSMCQRDARVSGPDPARVHRLKQTCDELVALLESWER